MLTPRSRSCLTPQTSCRFDGLNSEVRYTYDVTAAIEIVRLAENSSSLIRAPLHQVNTPFCLIVRPTQPGRAGELHGHQWFGCVQRTPLGRAEPCGADVRDGVAQRGDDDDDANIGLSRLRRVVLRRSEPVDVSCSRYSAGRGDPLPALNTRRGNHPCTAPNDQPIPQDLTRATSLEVESASSSPRDVEG